MNYSKTTNWTGRHDPDPAAYWHQTVQCLASPTEPIPDLTDGQLGFVLLGYASDEGTRRNQGRTGATAGPDAIREMAGSLANHFGPGTMLLDAGNVHCADHDLESTQRKTAHRITELLAKHYFPILLGGSHDLAYAQFTGIQKYLQHQHPGATLGIINIDAHFDLRASRQTAPTPEPPFTRSPNAATPATCPLTIAGSASSPALTPNPYSPLPRP